MRMLATAGVLLLILGCGESRPMLAGGKPVSYWVDAVHDPDPKVRKQAVFKLGNVGPGAPEALPAVTQALRDANAAVRREAILALIKFGAEAKSATGVLSEIRDHDRDVQVRSYAAKALAKLQGLG